MKTKDITVQRVLEITADKLGVEQQKLSYDTSFSDDLGADSLDVYELIVTIEKEFKLSIGDEDAEKITTIGKLIDYINSKLFRKTSSVTRAQTDGSVVALKVKEEIINKNLFVSPENN